MTIEQLQILHRARPFQPFYIHLADGRSIPVEHPEFLARSPNGRTIAVAVADDSHEIIDFRLVTRLEPRRNRPRRKGAK